MRESSPFDARAGIPSISLTRSIEPKARKSFNSCLKEA
jgi:hypothetical protein